MEPHQHQTRHEFQDRECVGSFPAYAANGTKQVIEIWIYRNALHYGELKSVSSATHFLITTDGQEVDRVEQGEYLLRNAPETIFTSSDPQAP